MPKKEYSLLFDEAVYADMVQYHYDSSLWMDMQHVRAEAARIPRSSKKLEELCRKGAIEVGDTWTMRKTDRDGNVIAFSATIEALDIYSIPMMRTNGQLNGNTWPCIGPSDFDQTMVRAHSGVNRSFRNTWDIISVTRNNQELGSLHLCRQCLQLWEDEMEKWGCNGLGESVGDRC